MKILTCEGVVDENELLKKTLVEDVHDNHGKYMGKAVSHRWYRGANLVKEDREIQIEEGYMNGLIHEQKESPNAA